MITLIQAGAMLALQDRMNAKVDPNWREAGYNWTRAIMVEGVEALGHIGWKWWKKEEADWEQFKIELVDIWHFALSDMMTEMSPEQAASVIEVAAERPRRYVTFNAVEHDLDDDLSMRQKIDLLVAMAGAGEFSLHVFRSIMEDADMSWDELYRGYVSKNVLNFFRQDHGYKDGAYIKNWHGFEDNVRLAEIVNTLDAQSPTFEADLYARLKTMYTEVLRDAAAPQ